ncbi:unnamed protein product [Cochlearia groenlandica]
MASNETPGDGACAACKWQRRRCVRDCPLRPYFPADKPEQFMRVRDLFGVNKVTKTLQELSLDIPPPPPSPITPSTPLEGTQNQQHGGVEDLRTLKRTAAAAFNPYAATDFYNPYTNTTINNNYYYYPGSISADGGKNGSFSGGGYFGNFREEEETRPFKRNQAQQQQFLDDSNGLHLFPARGNASFDNNENATYFLSDNAYAIQSLKNDERYTCPFFY